MPPIHPSERLFTPGQVAVWVSVTSMTVIRWCERGILPSTKTDGGHRRIPESAVRAYLREKGLPVPEELLPVGHDRPNRFLALARPRVEPKIVTAFAGIGPVECLDDSYAFVVSAVAVPPRVMLVDADFATDAPRVIEPLLEHPPLADAGLVVLGSQEKAFPGDARIRWFPRHSLRGALQACIDAHAARSRR